MWYYALDGKQAGPVSEQELAALVQARQLTLDSLVWREGMANWQPLREMQGTIPGLAALVPPSAAPLQPAGDQVVCAECRQIVPKGDAIQYSGSYICAACKPAFFQKVREGVAPDSPGGHRYAGFWVRFGAKCLDGIILWVLVLPITFLWGAKASGPGVAWQQIVAQQALVLGIGTIIRAAYNGFFVGHFGATPGKMACKLKVIRADGTQVGYGLAFGRFFAELLNTFTLLIGYIIAAFDDEKRALHDRICGTRVIYK
jgi:uncharacterized RDD family membrane protein YckC